MKHLPVVILLVALALMAVVSGCVDTPRYDGRLAQTDSLMRDNPDSALALLQRLDSAALGTAGDSAYRDLLLTQARYRCYITATSDSAINRALTYYRHHPDECEKLTRAYIYKGAVMEELGHPDSAMLYYKHAEATADTTDYYNLGYINTRIADLYRLYYGDKEICFKKYETALKYHVKSGNKQMQQNCYFNMAGCLGITGRANPDIYFKKALDIARELKDTFLIVESLELYLRQLSINDSTRQQAKSIALDCLDKYPDNISIDLLLDVAYIYAYEGDNETANSFLDIVDNAHVTFNVGQIISRSNSIHSIIARNEGNLALADKYTRLSHQMENSLTENQYRYFIQHLENTDLEVKDKKSKQRISALKVTLLVVSSLFAAIVAVFLIILYRRRKRIKSIIHELKQANDNENAQMLEQFKEKNASIQKLVKNLVAFMQTSIETAEHDSPAVIRKKIKETITDVADEDFWKELRIYLDTNYNNVISEIAENKRINDTDIRFIELMCCGFSYLEIAITLGYSPNFVSNKRLRITKKLGLNTTLQDYLNSAMNGRNHS